MYKSFETISCFNWLCPFCTLQVLTFFAGVLLEKQIVVVCSNLVCLVPQVKLKMILWWWLIDRVLLSNNTNNTNNNNNKITIIIIILHVLLFYCCEVIRVWLYIVLSFGNIIVPLLIGPWYIRTNNNYTCRLVSYHFCLGPADALMHMWSVILLLILHASYILQQHSYDHCLIKWTTMLLTQSLGRWFSEVNRKNNWNFILVHIRNYFAGLVCLYMNLKFLSWPGNPICFSFISYSSNPALPMAKPANAGLIPFYF